METHSEPNEELHFAMWVALAAVLGVLVMLLVPPMHQTNERANRTNCLGNLKRLGLSIEIYADDNLDRLPMDAANPTLTGSLRMMSNTLVSTEVLMCPTAASKRFLRPTEDWSSLTAKNISYIYVPNLIWQNKADL